MKPPRLQIVRVKDHHFDVTPRKAVYLEPAEDDEETRERVVQILAGLLEPTPEE